MLLGLTGGLVLKALGFVTLSLVEENTLWALAVIGLPLAAIALNSFLIWRNFDPTASAAFEKVAAWSEALAKMLSFRRASRAGSTGAAR